MQVTKKIIKPEFQPFEISIRVETKQQFDMLSEIAAHEVTVPTAIRDAGVINQQQSSMLFVLLQNIRNVIYSS